MVNKIDSFTVLISVLSGLPLGVWDIGESISLMLKADVDRIALNEREGGGLLLTRLKGAPTCIHTYIHTYIHT